MFHPRGRVWRCLEELASFGSPHSDVWHSWGIIHNAFQEAKDLELLLKEPSGS